MAPPPGSNPATLQFLSTVLSQRGPTALPYSEDVKWLIRQHLTSLSDSFPSLQPKTATFTHNDGRSVNLLQADGTLPMLYQGVTYNIPLVVWLTEQYPRHPPSVFVNPTRDMIIKRPHEFVNPSGLVTVPYLQNWIYPSSNLVDLARNCASYFARDPPLYSQRVPRPNPNPSPNPNNPVPSPNFGLIPQRGYPASPYENNGGGGRVYTPPPPPHRPVPAATEDPKEVYKRNATGKLVERVSGDVADLRRKREGEMESLFSLQQVMRQRESEIDRGLREMQGEKETLEHQLQLVLTDCDVVEGWLRENRGKVGVGNVDVDGAFEACDALSKQMLECTHSDLAVEDVIYALDKAVQDGTIPVDQYLRNVRSLSREQFFYRATAAKIKGVQMQAQVASMAARASQYAR